MPSRIKILVSLILLLCLFPNAAPIRADEPSLYEYIMSDLDGKETTLEAYRGRILVVEIFASWCPPCKKDLPQVASLQENYPAQRVTFLAVSADGTTDTARRVPGFVKEQGLKIPVLVGGSIFIDKFAGVDRRGMREVVLPQTYVFDSKGEISVRLVGEQKTKTKTLIETLDKLTKEGGP